MSRRQQRREARRARERSTFGNWRPGTTGGCIVSDAPADGHDLRENEDSLRYYGGHLVAESIASSAALHVMTAAPALYRFVCRMVVHADATDRTEAQWASIVEEGVMLLRRARGEQP